MTEVPALTAPTVAEKRMQAISDRLRALLCSEPRGRSSLLDHPAAGMRRVPSLDRGVPLVAAEGGQ